MKKKIVYNDNVFSIKIKGAPHMKGKLDIQYINYAVGLAHSLVSYFNNTLKLETLENTNECIYLKDKPTKGIEDLTYSLFYNKDKEIFKGRVKTDWGLFQCKIKIKNKKDKNTLELLLKDLDILEKKYSKIPLI